MPNHVSSRFIVTGPTEEIQRFLATVRRTDEDNNQTLDFNAIIPMPEGMKDTEASSTVEYAMWALGVPEAGFLGEGGRNPTQYPWAAQKGLTDKASVLAWLEKEHPDAIPKAKTQMALKASCGHYNWYSWSIANWGTKWNAYSCSFEENADSVEITFQTAWSFPEPIFEKLEEMFPSLVFDGHCYDEGSIFSGAGRYGASVEEGRFEIFEDASPDHYEAVHGHPMPVYDDEG